MSKRMVIGTLAAFVLLLLAAGCGEDEADEGAASDATDVGGAEVVDDGGDGGGGDGADDGSATDPDGSGDDSAGGDGSGSAGDGSTVGDDDDAAEITGNPDLPDDAAELLDDVDDVVSIGDCSSEVVGLAVTAPDGWRCRVLDQSVGGLDGFTVFTDGNQLNITIGTPSPLGAPCDVLGLCDQAEPIELSDNFPDTMQLAIAGTVTIWGTHATTDAEVVITNLAELTPEELGLVRAILDSAVEI